MTEFELIEKFFRKPTRLTTTRLAGGDDCALLKTSQTLALSIDTLVEGVHFFTDVDPYTLGYKALAINLSDLAAMGAKPLAFLLSLTLPDIDPLWLEKFSSGLYACADEYALDLIGGNTTRGPLNINITVMGEIEESKALKRDRACLHDDVYVTGHLGGAALGLQILQNKVHATDDIRQKALARLHMPTARIALAQALLDIAHAAIDISDGLAQDLTHILNASKLGAEIWARAIPIFMGSNLDLALHGGEDYELCFTAAQNQREVISALSREYDIPITHIGVMRAQAGLEILNMEGKMVPLTNSGYQHFKD